MKLTMGSLFDGSGGFPLAGSLGGIETLWTSEIEPFPIRVTTKRFPNAKHYGDISKLNGAELEPVDIITGGSPCQSLSLAGKREGMKRYCPNCGYETEAQDEETMCPLCDTELKYTRSGLFMEQIRVIKEMREATNGKYPRFMLWENVCFSEDTLVTTYDGFKKIKDVQAGDLVKTHTGNYKKVLALYKTEAQNTITLSVSGSENIRVTANHPFLVRTNLHTEKRSFSEPTWKKAGNLNSDDFVGYMVDGYGSRSIGMGKAYAVGRWLADGSLAVRSEDTHTGSRGGQRTRIFISTGYKKYENLKNELQRLPYQIRENKMRHAVNFTFTSDEFGELISQCGRGARKKRIPQWVFELNREEQEELLRGYLDGDGYLRRENQWSCATSSKELAYGLARLIRNVYHVGVSISYKMPKGKVEISGRLVNSNESWELGFSKPICKRASSGSFYSDGRVWCRVKSITKGGVLDVYNLSVDEDNTYEANGITVHNCGAFSSNKGQDFKAVLEETIGVKREISLPRPPKDKWQNAGCIVGDGYSVAWRVVDAQYCGVPQRRRRIVLIADFGGECAGEILFERYSLRGNFAQSQDERERTAGDTADSFGAADREVYSVDGYNSAVGDKATGDNVPLIMEPSYRDSAVYWDGSQTCGTLTANNAGGNQRMPDKDNFNCVVMRTTRNDTTCYNICSYASNAMKSKNPHSGIYQAEQSRTLDLNGGNPTCNQGGTMIVEPIYCSSRNSHFTRADKEIAGTLTATDYKQAPIVNDKAGQEYIVRRLTPLECCRLQGFPDFWCSDLRTPEPSKEDIAFWRDVFETHSQIVNGKPSKKTDKQIIKWLQNPYSDSAEYKMWGNGIALPCMARFLCRIPLQVQLEQLDVDDLLD